MKHLKVKGTLVGNMKRVTVEILEQTHIHTAFGCKCESELYDKFGGRAFKSGKIRLYSATDCAPGVYTATKAYGDDAWILMEANRSWGADTRTKGEFTCSLKMWEQIKEAVKAYNEWGATQDD